MNERTYVFINKDTWGLGEWNTEPDKVQWVDDDTRLPCLAVRHSTSGNWCGYVGITDGHPLFGIGYNECPLPSARPIGKYDLPFPMPQSFIERAKKRRTCKGGDYCDHTPESILDVHGRVTFSDFCAENDKEHGICHIPESGQPDKVWWFGFDCAHAGDLSPGIEAALKLLPIRLRKPDSLLKYEKYKNLDYVKAQCRGLANQLVVVKLLPK